MPGNVLLSHILRQSTIGAEGLNFRVRNGIGCGPFAIITRLSLIIFNSIFVNLYLTQKLINQISKNMGYSSIHTKVEGSG